MDEQGYDENLREGREQQQIIVIGQGDIHIICVVRNVLFAPTHFVLLLVSVPLSVLCGPPASNGRIGLAASINSRQLVTTTYLRRSQRARDF